MPDTLIRRGGHPFAMLYRVAARLLRDPYLIAVYWCIADHADREGNSWPGVARIAEETGMSERKARGCVHELEVRGILLIEARYGESGVRTSNAYVLLDSTLHEGGGTRHEVQGTRHDVPGNKNHSVSVPSPSVLPDKKEEKKAEQGVGEKTHEPITKASQMHLSAQGQRRVEKAKGKRVKAPVVGEGTVLPPRAKKPDYYDLAEKAERMARGEK